MNQLRYIRFVSFLLFSVFFIPQVIQTHHILTVHHHHTVCTEKTIHFHRASDHCPVHEYIFGISDRIEVALQLSVLNEQRYKSIITNTSAKKTNRHYWYYERGPPN